MRINLSNFLALAFLSAGALAQQTVNRGVAVGHGNPAFSTVAGELLVSDDFNNCAGIDPVWTAFDPLGDAQFSIVGAGSGDAFLEIDIPAGSEHQSFGSLTAPYLAQSVPNISFEVELAFESLPADGQLIGLMVLQDSQRWIRFDLYGFGGSVFLYSGVTRNGNTSNRANVLIGTGSGPARMRIVRLGSNWNCEIAVGDGAFQSVANYNFNLSVGEVGPYAGNFGSFPAHTARFDYVFDNTAPILDEDAGFTGGTSTVTVQTVGAGQVLLDPPGGSYACGTLVTVSALPDAGANFEGWSGALFGLDTPQTLVASGNQLVTATFNANADLPPVLTALNVQADTDTALVSWQTDIPADSRASLTLGASPAGSMFSPALVTSHQLMLVGLLPNTTYELVVESVSAAGLGAQASTQFVTLDDSSNNPPVLNGLDVQATDVAAIVRWQTDIASDSTVTWSLGGDTLGSVSDPALVTDHQLDIAGLMPDTSYAVTVQSATSAGSSSQTSGTFVTNPGSPGGFESDDFQSCDELGLPWTFTNSPQGDGTAMLTTVGNDSILSIEVPAGVEHQAFGALTAPYVTQDVNDEDLEIEAKFLTRPLEGFAIQGLLALESESRWLRFDTYGTGSTTRWYVGRSNNGSTVQVGEGPLPALGEPMWVQVARSGDQWTYRYSIDGEVFTDLVTFSFSLDLAKIGPYAGNASGAGSPGFRAEVDYVFTTDAPILLEDESTVGEFILAVDVPAGGGSVAIDPLQANYSCGDVVTLTAQPVAGMVFDFWSGDASGAVNPLDFVMGANSTVFANFAPVNSGPIISGISASAGELTAQVVWTTDVPANSRVDFGLTTAYGQTVESTALTTSHSLLLSGLTPGTVYQFQVRSASPSGTTLSANQSFTTTNPPPPSGIASDDFNERNLDLGLWDFTDPAGLAELRMVDSGTPDAHMELEIPSGASYTPFGVNNAARISQPAPDTDLSFTVRFESEIASVNSSTGVFVEADDNDWVRFDFFFDGANLNLFSSSFTNGTPGDLRNTVVQSGPWPEGSPLFLRVSRGGVIWSADYSFDGVNFLTGNSFFQSLAVQRAGILCGNDSNNPLAHRVAADWFFDTGAPIFPEDPAPGTDVTNPFLYSASALVLGPNAAELRWRTDELTSGSVVYGLDTTYAGGSADSLTPQYEHVVLVTGLVGGSTYHFLASATDAAGNSVDGLDMTFQTPGIPAFGEPEIDFWYGAPDSITGTNVQRFGHLGDTQAQLNVVGRVADADEDRVALTVDLQYRLNGGPLLDADLGDDRTINYEPWRLANEGDFNIELFPDELIFVPLQNGVHRNVLELVATDDDGNQTIRPCFVDYTPGVDWEPNPTVDWSAVLSNQGGVIADVAQVVDGLWNVEDLPGLGTVLRTDPANQGYDRIVALGESTGQGAWVDYEALIPVTVLALDPQGFTTGTGSHAMGIILRWGGHTEDGPFPQPFHGIYPLGAIWIYRWFPNNERWQLWINENEQILNQQGNNISIGTTYLYRVRCEGQPGGETFYSIKFWEQGTSEPSTPTFTHLTNPGDPVSGSLAVFGHHVDMAVGDIQVNQL